jgi:hypothetical protein
MIEHVWSVLCSRAILDRDTNSVSLIDIVEEITIQGPVLPSEEGGTSAFTITMALVSLWRRDPEDQPTKGQARVLLFAPNGEPLKEFSVYSIDLSEKLRMRAFGNIPVFPFRGPGSYHFSIQLQDEREEEWKEVASIPLRLIVTTPST